MNLFEMWLDFWVGYIDTVWGIHKRAWDAHMRAEGRRKRA